MRYLSAVVCVVAIAGVASADPIMKLTYDPGGANDVKMIADQSADDAFDDHRGTADHENRNPERPRTHRG